VEEDEQSAPNKQKWQSRSQSSQQYHPDIHESQQEDPMEDVVSPRELGRDWQIVDPFEDEKVPERHGS